MAALSRSPSSSSCSRGSPRWSRRRSMSSISSLLSGSHHDTGYRTLSSFSSSSSSSSPSSTLFPASVGSDPTPPSRLGRRLSLLPVPTSHIEEQTKKSKRRLSWQGVARNLDIIQELPSVTSSSSPSNSSTSSMASTSGSPPRSPPVALKSALRSPVTSPAAEKSADFPTSSSPPPLSSTSQSHSRPSTATSAHSSSTAQSGFIPRVSFDATQASAGHGGGTGIEQSFTLRATTAGFTRTRESRTFLVATDLNEYSLHALHWSLDSLIEDGDEIVVLRVLDPSVSSISLNSTALSDQARDEARLLIDSVIERNSYVPPSTGSTRNSSAIPLTEIGITVEFVIGKVQESIQKMIAVYRPDSLIVGTRGRTDSLFKSAFIGSVSKYCVANSPVPVIVVKPAIKVRKSISKREGRQSYLDLVEGSGTDLSKSTSRLGLYKSSTMPVNKSESTSSVGSATRANTAGTDGVIRGAPLTQTKTMS